MTALLPIVTTDAAVDRACRTLEVQRGLLEHMPSLARHALRVTRSRNDANDLVQETAVRALAFAWSFQSGTNVRAWLHQVLDSVFLSQCRRRSRERRACDALTHDPCAWTQHDAEPAMQALSPRVARALESLPLAFREVVRLIDVEDLSYRDAAERLAVPLGTIMSRLHRGRRQLATALGEEPKARAA